MAKVLTVNAKVTCAHQGTVQITASQQVLKVGTQAVLVLGDLDNKPIASCKQPASSTTKPCTTALTMTAGAAVKLAVRLETGTKAVLLATASGPTDSAPPAIWTVQSAGQTKLDAT